jgi:hypothetical protein
MVRIMPWFAEKSVSMSKKLASSGAVNSRYTGCIAARESETRTEGPFPNQEKNAAPVGYGAEGIYATGTAGAQNL